MTPRLEPWERKLYEYGYAAALADAAKVLIRHAQGNMKNQKVAGPLLDAGMEVTKLMNLTSPDRECGEVAH